MKIPTAHIKTKHTIMFAGALAATVGLTPTLALAHGGGEGGDGHSGFSRTNRDADRHQYGGMHMGGHWWGMFTVDQFQTRHDDVMTKLNTFVTDNNLSVESQATLVANIDTAATNVKTELSALTTLKSTYDPKTATDEQKQAVKEQAQKMFDAFHAYRDSMKAYKTAIHIAAEAAGVSIDMDAEDHHDDKS